MVLYGTLSQLVLQTILIPDAIATNVWKAIEDIFHENKQNKSLELDKEIQNLDIGDAIIMEWCTRIKSIVGILRNIGAPVTERNLVIYTLVGLSPKFSHIVTTIRHQKTISNMVGDAIHAHFEERAMLKDQNKILLTPHLDNSSALMILNT